MINVGAHVTKDQNVLISLVFLESPTVMLSAGSFSSPYEHLSQPETKRMVEHYTAYLSDNTRLIANPGLKVLTHTPVSLTAPACQGLCMNKLGNISHSQWSQSLFCLNYFSLLATRLSPLILLFH